MSEWSRAAEITVLAAAFGSRVTRDKLRTIVTASDFFQPGHEKIWSSLLELDALKEEPTIAAVAMRCQHDEVAAQALPELARAVSGAEGMSSARIVHDLAVKRRTRQRLNEALLRIESADAAPAGFLSELVNDLTAMRDENIVEDFTAVTLRELLDTEDEPYDWLIPQVLERGDRLMLTGEEGQGKSWLLRQIAVCYAAGLHPFGRGRIQPGNVLLVDAENTERQVRRGMRGLAEAIANRGTRDPRDHVLVECTGRIDVTDDLVLSKIHRTIDAQQPDIVVIGPLYRITRGALQTDDDAAPVLAAIDTIKDRGIAVLIEAHAGHSQRAGGGRDMRPRGSSALLGWPEFGYGLRANPEVQGQYLLERWRGDRDERDWPTELERGGVLPWNVTENQALKWVGAA